MKFETVKQNRLRTAGFAIAAGIASLALASCGSDSEDSSSRGATPIESMTSSGMEHTYLDDGSRLTTYPGSGDAFSDVLAYCDGSDLVEQTDFNQHYKAGAGNNIARSAGHPACTDGRLTATDFTIEG